MEHISQISYIDSVKSVVSSCSLDFDIILPEYFDTISKILDCIILPVCESTNISGDKINVSGIAKLQILFTGEDGKLYCYKNEQKYTKVIQVTDISPSACLDINQRVVSLNFRALGPKRVSVKSNIMISVFPTELKAIDVIQLIEDECIEVNKNSKDVYIPVAFAERDILINGEISLSESLNENAEIIRSDTIFEINDTKTIHNKVYINGNCHISMLYFTEGCKFTKTKKYTIPFSEILDINGIEDNIECYIDHKINDTRIFKSEAANSNTLSVNISVTVKVNALNKDTVVYIDDLFCTENELEASFSDVVMIENTECKNEILSISCDDDGLIGSEFDIIDSWTDEISIVSAQDKDSKNVVVLCGNYKILIKSRDGEISCIVNSFSKDLNIPSNISYERKEDIKVKLSSITSLQTSNDKIRTTMDFVVEVKSHNTCKARMLTNYSKQTDDCRKTDKGVVLYFASKGEKIWDIAKHNKVSVEKVMSHNDLKEQILKNDTMLFLPNF